MDENYEWPRVTIIHPEHGSYEMNVHCIRSPEGILVLVAFLDTPSHRQVELVDEVATELGVPVELLMLDDIPYDLGVELATQFHARPGAEMGIVRVRVH